MQRLFIAMVAGLVMVVGLTACGGGDDAGGDTDATEDVGGEGSTDTVQAYCAAVDEFVAAVEAAGDDGAAQAELQDEAQQLAEESAELAGAGLSAEEAQEISECAQRAATALTPGG